MRERSYTPPVSFSGGRRRHVPSLDKRGGLRPERARPSGQDARRGAAPVCPESFAPAERLARAQEDVWAFRSRPDLSPPAVEVTTQAHDTAPGYIFVAPEKGDARQGGSMIVDDRGEVVWFRPLQGKYGRAHDLKVQSYRGKSVLTWMDRSKRVRDLRPFLPRDSPP